MFVDIHCHALPGVDDGPKEWEMTLTMFRQAVEQGISHLVMTPHFIEGDLRYSQEMMQSAFERAKQLIRDHGIDLRLFLGNEIFIDQKNVERLIKKECMSLNDTDYVLLELPEYILPGVLEDLVYDLQLEGYQVVFAHIERYDWLLKRKLLFQHFMDQGVLMQINATSLLSKDWHMSRRAKRLVREGLVHVVASDAHDDVKRRFRLKEAYDLVGNKFGWQVANRLFVENPLRIIRNKHVELPGNESVESWWRK
jgi:protein-tyrosine phosphatase